MRKTESGEEKRRRNFYQLSMVRRSEEPKMLVVSAGRTAGCQHAYGLLSVCNLNNNYDYSSYVDQLQALSNE
jgi:hypothetical protein